MALPHISTESHLLTGALPDHLVSLSHSHHSVPLVYFPFLYSNYHDLNSIVDLFVSSSFCGCFEGRGFHYISHQNIPSDKHRCQCIFVEQIHRWRGDFIHDNSTFSVLPLHTHTHTHTHPTVTYSLGPASVLPQSAQVSLQEPHRSCTQGFLLRQKVSQDQGPHMGMYFREQGSWDLTSDNLISE